MRRMVLGMGGAMLLAVGIAGCTAVLGEADPANAAPDFELASVGGGTVALDDFAGKPVLLYFHMAVG